MFYKKAKKNHKSEPFIHTRKLYSLKCPSDIQNHLKNYQLTCTHSMQLILKWRLRFEALHHIFAIEMGIL